MNNTPTTQPSVSFSAFLPVVLLSLSFCVILVWTLVVSVYEYSALLRQRDKQNEAQLQAVNVEEKMKALMIDLLSLAETDPDAKAIAEKYQVRFNAPAGGTQPLTPAKPGEAAPSAAPTGRKPPQPAPEAKEPAATPAGG
jgi:cell division protein FtsB